MVYLSTRVVICQLLYKIICNKWYKSHHLPPKHKQFISKTIRFNSFVFFWHRRWAWDETKPNKRFSVVSELLFLRWWIVRWNLSGEMWMCTSNQADWLDKETFFVAQCANWKINRRNRVEWLFKILRYNLIWDFPNENEINKSEAPDERVKTLPNIL